MLGPAARHVILGSPGAGTSTLLAKTAHDLGRGDGLTPFLVVLRDFAAAFLQGERALIDYLEAVCREPCNLEPPAGAVEYLLRNGRAAVLLDGLDELVDQSLRTRVVRLVEGFAYLYPLTPIVITARAVGYEAAPLDAGLFRTLTLEDFDDDQVGEYARRWFTLDEATDARDRATLAENFLQESARAAEELRKSPLLLALLCGLPSALVAARRGGLPWVPAERSLSDVEEAATAFLLRWCRREFDVIGKK